MEGFFQNVKCMYLYIWTRRLHTHPSRVNTYKGRVLAPSTGHRSVTRFFFPSIKDPISFIPRRRGAVSRDKRVLLLCVDFLIFFFFWLVLAQI